MSVCRMLSEKYQADIGEKRRVAKQKKFCSRNPSVQCHGHARITVLEKVEIHLKLLKYAGDDDTCFILV